MVIPNTAKTKYHGVSPLNIPKLAMLPMNMAQQRFDIRNKFFLENLSINVPEYKPQNKLMKVKMA